MTIFYISLLTPKLARAIRQCHTIKPVRIQNMSKFQIKKQSNNQFRFIMKAGNGLTILTSEPYETRDECLAGIETLRKYVPDKNRYEFKKSLNLKHYFIVKDADGKIIGSIEMYESSSGRDLGIGLVKANAPDAVIEDLT